MSLVPAQFIAVNTACLDSMLLFTNAALTGTERFSALNAHMARSMVKSSADSSKALLESGDIDLLSLSTAQVQPVAENLMAYGRSVYEIGSDTMESFDNALDLQAGEWDKLTAESLAEAKKNAFPGMEMVIPVAESFIAAAGSAFTRIRGVVKQIVGGIHIRGAAQMEKLSPPTKYEAQPDEGLEPEMVNGQTS
jgi:phasin family protein